MLKTFKIKTTTNETISFVLDLSYNGRRRKYVDETIDKACNTKVFTSGYGIWFVNAPIDENGLTEVAGLLDPNDADFIEAWTIANK
jgi:hypothetical protein